MVGVYIKDKTTYVALVITASALLNIVLNIILIPLYNIYGAAIATVVSYIFLAALGYTISQRFYRINYDFINISKTLAAGSIIIYWNFHTSIFGSFDIFIKIALPFLYFFILYLAKFFKKEDIEMIKGLWENLLSLKRK